MTQKAVVLEKTAVVEIVKCGSVEGWHVRVTDASTDPYSVFVSRMPPPISVDDIPAAVQIRWDGPGHLIVSAPRWIRFFKRDANYHGIVITYLVNNLPYPSPGGPQRLPED